MFGWRIHPWLAKLLGIPESGQNESGQVQKQLLINKEVECTSLSGVITCGQCGKQTDLGVIAYDHADPEQQAKAVEENPNLTRTEPFRKLCGCS